MILSQKKIEEIAVAVIRDFQKSFFGSEADDPARFALPTPIDQFCIRLSEPEGVISKVVLGRKHLWSDRVCGYRISDRG